MAFIVSRRLKLGSFRMLKQVDAVGRRSTSLASPSDAPPNVAPHFVQGERRVQMFEPRERR